MVEKTKKKGKENNVRVDSVAMAFINSKESVYYEDKTIFIYNGSRYERREAEVFEYDVSNFLTDVGIDAKTSLINDIIKKVKATIYQNCNGRKMPFYIGQEDRKIIAFKNCLLDIETGELLEHTKKWVSEHILPFDYDPSATCPKWESYLSEIFEDDVESVQLLQEWFGYCLSDDTSQQKLLLKIGLPRAGKGTTDKILQALLGKENYTAYQLHSLADQFAFEPLIGKKVAFVSEVNLQGVANRAIIVNNLNAIVGEDDQTINRKFQKQINVKLPTRFTVSCNELPKVFDSSGALRARFLILPFNKSFLNQEDRQLDKKLLQEVSGIYNWALIGLQRLRVNKSFTQVKLAEVMYERFRDQSSSTACFAIDELVAHKDCAGAIREVEISDKPQRVILTELEAAYNDWIEDNRDKTRQSWQFVKRELESLFPKVKNKRAVFSGKKLSVFDGIGLKKAKNGHENVQVDTK